MGSQNRNEGIMWPPGGAPGATHPITKAPICKGIQTLNPADKPLVEGFGVPKQLTSILFELKEKSYQMPDWYLF